MQCISRKEQERIIGIIKQEYDIIKESLDSKALIIQTEKLLKELVDINKDRFFEEDLRRCIDNFSTKLASYMKLVINNS